MSDSKHELRRLIEDLRKLSLPEKRKEVVKRLKSVSDEAGIPLEELLSTSSDVIMVRRPRTAEEAYIVIKRLLEGLSYEELLKLKLMDPI